MKTKFLVSLIAILAILLVTPFAAANTLEISAITIEMNGMDISTDTVAGEAGEVVPIDFYFTADENASEVEISAWVQGHRSDAAEIDFRDLIDGKQYHAKLSLKLPTDIDPEEDLTLYVRIETDEGNWEEDYTVSMQRKPYKSDLLFVEVESRVEAGSNVPVDVVVKNLGRHELEDLVVSVSIPELGISKRAYFGDLSSTDTCDDDDCDKYDAVEKKVYLRIPMNTEAGIYELVVEAYNDDARAIVTKDIEIIGVGDASNAIAPITSKGISVGATEVYDLIIVNSGNKLGVYEIIPESAEGVIVSVSDPIVTVQADSSKVVKIEVKAGSREGTYGFAVNVHSDGKLVKRVALTANITSKTIGGNMTILTIILAIIFIVLLIVLIVLLTRRPIKPEELEESYY